MAERAYRPVPVSSLPLPEAVEPKPAAPGPVVPGLAAPEPAELLPAEAPGFCWSVLAPELDEPGLDWSVVPDWDWSVVPDWDFWLGWSKEGQFRECLARLELSA